MAMRLGMGSTQLNRFVFLVLSVLFLHSASLTAQDPSYLDFTERTEMVPVRDGVRLHTRIFTPRQASEPLPMLLLRTPYGIEGAPDRIKVQLSELARDGYIFVFQDIRGRYKSEGKFVMNRPMGLDGVDERTDAYDTIGWLITNVKGNNGRVGALGISYPGWLAAMAGIKPHPALKATSPQAPMTDTWMGDDFFHRGAFRLSYGFEYAADMELSSDGSVPLPIDVFDTYDWYLRQGPPANLTKLLAGRVPTWTAFTQHPTYDGFWKARALPTYLTAVSVPTLTVGGWWDQEDLYGALATYAALEPHDSGGRNVLVMGPWNHGGWSRGEGRKLGAVDFGQEAGRSFREMVQAPWFACWLKDRGTRAFAEALMFDAGTRAWREFDQWPPKQRTETRKLYLLPGGKLGFNAPTSTAGAFDAWVSDPSRPVPYRQRPVEQTSDPRGSRWSAWMTEDQRFVHNRPDVMSWQTDTLTEDLSIAGYLAATLFASTTGSDADWAVKLIDVYPEDGTREPRMNGFQLMVAGDILRGRYRRGFDRPEPIRTNTVLPYTVDLQQQSYTFRKGHRIMVQVQSTWFPVYDRNPQTWVPNIFQAKASDYRSATHKIWRTSRYPSHVSIPVLVR